MSEIEQMMQEIQAQREEATRKADRTAKSLFEKLRLMGIDAMDISFDGSGDSGSIDEIFPDPGKLRDEVVTWAENVLEGTGVDWYNNDGGFGTILVDTHGPSYKYEVHTRRTDSDLEAADTVIVT